MTRRNEPLQIIWRLCLVVLLGLPVTSYAAQSGSAQPSEGEIAIELFGLIAEQSGCRKFVVAWVYRANQQVHAHCADSLEKVEQMLVSSDAAVRFVIDVSIANGSYQTKSESKAPKNSAALLAHLLATARHSDSTTRNQAPLLLYRQSTGRENYSGLREVTKFLSGTRRLIIE